MAIYTIQIKPISRSSGHSAIAKIAYNCRDKITDIRSGEIHKYNSKKMSADLLHSEITHKDLTLDKKERSEIWNNAELAENRRNSRTAREYVVALPKELSTAQNIELVRAFAKELTTKYNNVADWAIHDGKDDNGNIHAHILTTTRQYIVENNTLGDKTDLELDNGTLIKQHKPISQDQIKTIRKDWETIQNQYLAMAGLDLTVSCDKKQDRDTVKKHLGKEATALERKGTETELGNYNRTIDDVMQLERQLQTNRKYLAEDKAELKQLEDDLMLIELNKLIAEKQKEQQLNQQRKSAKEQELARLERLTIEQKQQEQEESKQLDIEIANAPDIDLDDDVDVEPKVNLDSGLEIDNVAATASDLDIEELEIEDGGQSL